MTTKITSDNIEGATLALLTTPKISSVTYPGDDTAADIAGGQSIMLTGGSFVAGASVFIGGTIVSVATVISSTIITFLSPVKAAGSYTLLVANADGGTASFVPGIQYSGTPAWSTSAGSLATVYETAAVSNTLAAASDSAITYSVTSGTLPAGINITANTGVISGTAPGVSGSATYNFTVDAVDAEKQNTSRNFSYTINPDVVTWNTPADSTTYVGVEGDAFTQALSAVSAAGKAISYSANTLPTGFSISGANISGTFGAATTSASLITATAAITGKTATRTVNWLVTSTTRLVEYLVVAGGGAGGNNSGPYSNGTGGGGGAGGFRTATGYTVSTGSTITVGVGAGGGYQASGSPSVFGTITATGGGRAGFVDGDRNGVVGGSGGGGCQPTGLGAAGIADQGNAGANMSGTTNAGQGGGGGGAGSAASARIPGPGTYSSITGTSTPYAGGGAGGTYRGSYDGTSAQGGGLGGGGTGGFWGNYSGNPYAGLFLPSAGTVNTGGGGGGDGGSNVSVAGGSGIVIIRYLNTYPAASATTGSPTITNTGGYRIYKFTSSGSITF